MHCLQILKSDFTQMRWVTSDDASLKKGEVRLRLKSYSLTANNVSYALAGDSLGYWRFFPSQDDHWGQVPVMGVAEVSESTMNELAVGTLVWGWFPMTDEMVVEPGRVTRYGFTDANLKRGDNAAIYRRYEFFEDDDLTHYRMSLKGLFTTSWLFAQSLQLERYSATKQVVLTSASSKTALALAYELKAQDIHVVGLTSASNKSFVTNTQLYGEVLSYDEVRSLSTMPTVIVDFAGDSGLLDVLSEHLSDNLIHCGLIGATKNLPKKGGVLAERRKFFFAPHAAEELAEAGLFDPRAVDRSLVDFSRWASGLVDLAKLETDAEVEQGWLDLLGNRVDPNRMLVVTR